ncbi:zinc finger and BTB domain-containing protein 42-like [Hemibagrus wyckioides]|uniref:zinc finger and BTB domain-containing protein 42-like n=1 Tax=Hemibagrus wyckioides TaxID=337641 RepID=UPI00266B6B80|nr:zinc finger and BTB domain-containing protein 42-like [Hemibagrus wyckioides]
MNYHHYSEEPCDAIIEAGGVYFPVHQQAMLDLSPTFFSDLFAKGPTEFSVYTVHNVSVNIMRSIIQYAYSKKINITRRNVKDLLAAAEYLSVSDIVQLCKQFPEKQHCEEDSCDTTESPATHFWPDVPPWERSLLYKLGVFPPSAYEPNASPPSAYEPNASPPSAYEPNASPPSAYEPNASPPSAYEPNASPPSAYEPNASPPSAYEPNASPPTSGDRRDQREGDLCQIYEEDREATML